MASFTVKGGGDASKPTTTNSGQVMSDNKTKAKSTPTPNTTANANAGASPAPLREGKDVAKSNAGEVDPTKPLLTYSRPKGEYKAEDADPIMIDFWLVNASLTGNGGDFEVRYSVDGGPAQMIKTWAPIWLTGWINGKHTVKLELVDPKTGNPIE